ncbi:sulfatase [Sphingomonas sp. AR_OL41]|uniref:sulfatase family protein n=1 Tax=Sphingomonas sp. AR_OL41 TaxID=3042729 RepID=UPI002480124E|nr:sulfatase [Sphingomonas sp. AR_OL41]MDH7975323.1 sulfatase [Sphingomonas sp. AR_OL41]
MTLTRRTAIGLLSSAAMAPGVVAAPPPARRRPNILFILADDWGWESARPIDPANAVMPNFARVKREGMSFPNAFAAAPSCTASRGAILSGQWPWRLREGANLQGALPQGIPLYTELLAQAGYHVGSTRKGWGPGSIEATGRVINPAGKTYASFDTFLAARNANAPFCFWFGSNDPHRPFEKGKGVANGIDPASVDVPPYLPDTPTVRSDIADYRYALERIDREFGELLARLERDGELDNTLIVYTGDNGWAFPRAKATLFDAGWHVPLAIMWNGQIRAGTESKALVSLIDLAATFLDVAGVPQPKAMTALSLMGVLRGQRATHRRYVLGGTERHMDGRTLPGQGYPARAIRTDRHLFIRNFRPERWPAGDPERRPVTAADVENDIWAAFADIDKGPAKAEIATNPAYAKYREMATGKRPARMLYDVVRDPDEFTNLAGDAAQRNVMIELEARLMAELRVTGDPRAVAPLGDIFDAYPPHASGNFARPATWSQG